MKMSKAGQFWTFSGLLGPFVWGIPNGIFRTFKCSSFGVSRFRGLCRGTGRLQAQSLRNWLKKLRSDQNQRKAAFELLCPRDETVGGKLAAEKDRMFGNVDGKIVENLGVLP